MNQKVIKLFHLIQTTYDFFSSEGVELTKDIVTEVVLNFQPNPLLNIDFNDSDKHELIKYSCKALGIDTAEYVAFRGLALTLNDGLEEPKHDKYVWDKYLKHRAFIQSEIYPENPEVVESIDYETDQILKALPNPYKVDYVDFRALIIGHIQSGKTANFTHLISKLASLRYRFIIVLSGMTNALREQTQFRIDRELTGNNVTQSSLSFVKWTTGEKGYRTLTNLSPCDTNYSGDFEIPLESFDHLFEDENTTVIAVVKKLARESGNQNQEFGSVIGKLILWITQSQNFRNVPVAIIDDESDQASVDNTDPNKDEDPSTINRAIRTLLSKFDRTSYFGYTATPFANVFISPLSLYQGIADLYPKDLIYALPKPREYFGTEEFFLSDGISKYIVLTPPSERAEINDFDVIPTESFLNAIRDFFFGFLEKRISKNQSRSAMLIHTDHRNDNHEILSNKVEIAVDRLKTRVKSSEIIKELNRYRSVSGSLLVNLGQVVDWYDITHAEIVTYSTEFFRELEVRVINNRNDNIDYNREELKTMICIGGNILSRGLTIEGLITTYYLRQSNNYDTLLQMGRWFGYRMHYHHLMRIYISQTIYDQFEYMSEVESDLRSEINRYIEEGLEPLDFAQKVRAHTRMLPSSRMGSALRIRSFSHKIAQTFHLSRDINHILSNESLVNNLLDNHSQILKQVGKNYEFNNLDIVQLINFIRDYEYPIGLGMDNTAITEYIKKQMDHDAFSTFDLLVSSRNTAIMGAEVETYCANKLKWNPNKRNHRAARGLDYIEHKSVNVGVLSSTQDIPSPDDESFTKPKLILYSIDRHNSNAFREYDYSNGTLDLYNTMSGLNVNPKGFVVAFPKSRIESDRNDYYQQIF